MAFHGFNHNPFHQLSGLVAEAKMKERQLEARLRHRHHGTPPAGTKGPGRLRRFVRWVRRESDATEGLR